jgi:kinesin family protein C2/C3
LYEKWLCHLVTATQDLRSSSEGSKSLVLELKKEWAGWMGVVGTQMEELARQAEGYQALFTENRKLYNEVLDLKGSIRVYCRVRPTLDGSDKSTVDHIGDNGDIMLVNPSKQGRDTRRIFNFHKVFSAAASQEDVYSDTQPLIRSVLDGYNVCIFAYGQTGSGKTYTMTGPNSMGLGMDLGVNYRALNDLFMITESRKDAFQYEIGAQMIEIYNEQVRDLLSAPGSAIKKLEIRNHHAHLNVPDACLMSVSSKDDVLELMKIGSRNRAVGATALNERSSRSHSVLTVHVQGVDLSTGALLRGSLHLVDLAGSERIDKSEVTGDRLKEALHINRSLSALGDVIAALAQKSAHVPYRNSKLTQLLQDSLGGQGKALMVVHITADADSYGETMSTLKFAERVATVELGAARSNRESGEIRELKEQIANLKDAVAQKDAEVERLRSSPMDEQGMRTPVSKIKRTLGSGTGLSSRRLTKDINVLSRKTKTSPEGGGFGSTNVRFV